MYWSRYRLPAGGLATTQVYARDEAHLEEVLALRGLEETPCPQPMMSGDAPKMPSEHFGSNKLAAAHHALVWVSMIAVKAKVTDGWDLLNDQGLLHRMAHLLQSEAAYSPFSSLFGEKQRLLDDIRAFERRVPGVHPCWALNEDERVAPPTPLDMAPEIAGGAGGKIDYLMMERRAYAALMHETAPQVQLRAPNAMIDETLILGPDADAPRDVHGRRQRVGDRGFALASVAQGLAAKEQRVAKLLAKHKTLNVRVAGLTELVERTRETIKLASASGSYMDVLRDLPTETVMKFRDRWFGEVQAIPRVGSKSGGRSPSPFKGVSFDFEQGGLAYVDVRQSAGRMLRALEASVIVGVDPGGVGGSGFGAIEFTPTGRRSSSVVIDDIGA